MEVELRGVTKRFRRVCALDDVSLSIEPGQIVALLGSNGAGKTTLLRCLSGILGAKRGDVLLNGRPFRRGDLELRRQIAFLPDFPVVIEEWTVLRHVAITLGLYGRDDDDAGDRVIELLREFDMLPYAEVPYQRLSRGQRYKGALVALIAADPALWLLDEPFASGMDPHGIKAFQRYARQAAERGHTIIYSTQIVEVVERFADRVCVLHKGKMHAFDAPDRLAGETGDSGTMLDNILRDLRAGDLA